MIEPFAPYKIHTITSVSISYLIRSLFFQTENDFVHDEKRSTMRKLLNETIAILYYSHSISILLFLMLFFFFLCIFQNNSVKNIITSKIVCLRHLFNVPMIRISFHMKINGQKNKQKNHEANKQTKNMHNIHVDEFVRGMRSIRMMLIYLTISWTSDVHIWYIY